MEQLLHYVWKHKLWPLKPLATTDGQSVEIIDVGTLNTNAGPDFFNAKLSIEGQLWVGNVEIHLKASDWFRHRHHEDAAYNSVVLHVVETADAVATTSDGRAIPTLVLPIPETIRTNYDELQRTDRYPPCYSIVGNLPRLTVHSWMEALQIERLERKTSEILRRVELCGGSWEAACFVTLARNFGFGTNSDVFEEWAMNIPLDQAAHHRDDILQIEALFFGQSGLIDAVADGETDDYLLQLRSEYRFLQHKYGLKPIDATHWRFLRMRPHNFPHIRIAQLAAIYCSRHASLSRLAECTSTADVSHELEAEVSDYWQHHYSFCRETSTKSNRRLSKATVELIAINTVAPLLFAYGRHRMSETMADRAFQLLEQIKAENNNVVRMWRECGLDAATAGDSQALLQLKTRYCDRRDCLRCRIGYEYLKK